TSPVPIQHCRPYCASIHTLLDALPICGRGPQLNGFPAALPFLIDCCQYPERARRDTRSRTASANRGSRAEGLGHSWSEKAAYYRDRKRTRLNSSHGSYSYVFYIYKNKL